MLWLLKVGGKKFAGNCAVSGAPLRVYGSKFGVDSNNYRLC
jgi:hypothetical protein